MGSGFEMPITTVQMWKCDKCGVELAGGSPYWLQIEAKGEMFDEHTKYKTFRYVLCTECKLAFVIFMQG
jgi:hypothetical protein